MIRYLGETIVRGVDWPLDAVIREVLAVELRARSLDANLAWQFECEGLFLDLALPLGEALSSAGVRLSPAAPLRAFVQVAETSSVARERLESAAPSLRPPGPALRPAAPAQRPSSPASMGGLPTGAFGSPTSSPAMPPPAPWVPSPYAPPAAETLTGASEARPASPLDERRATVRYFSRMNPQRVFPLVVSIAPYAVLTSLGPDVARAVSEKFSLDGDSLVEIEPVLPGCTCHPPKLSVDPRAGIEIKADFWVVPQVLGRVSGAEVYVRHGKHTVRIPLKISVIEPRAAKVTGVLSLTVPYLSTVMKHYHLDFDSQLSEGFSLYLTVARAAFFTLGPTQLFALLVGVSAGLWWWARPRQSVAHDDPEALLANPSLRV